MLKLAVVGKDVSASLSPRMHTFVLNKLGLECVYERCSVSPESFRERAESLFSRYDGFNVTIPFKTEIIPFLHLLRGDAKAFGAVNTVSCGTRTGDNTDGYGFLLMLENAGVDIRGGRTLVLGAGGAGRSCVCKLTEAGARVSIFERDEARLKQVHDELGGFTPLEKVPLEPFDLIVNCTGIGMHDTTGSVPEVRMDGGGREPVTERLLPLAGIAVDLIYEPAESEFLRIARMRGKKTVNGESMLFYQAYASDCIWLDRTPSAAEAKELYKMYREETE